MDVIHTLSCLYNDRLTSPTTPLVNWEGCQHLYGWFNYMVHHTPFNASGSRFCTIWKPPCHAQERMGCDTRYKWSWMGCNKFHISSWDIEKGLTCLGCNLQIGMPSIQATDLPKCGSRFCSICKSPCHSQGTKGCDTMNSGHGWVDIHFTWCLVDSWKSYDRPGMQSSHRDALHPGHRPPKMLAQVWQDLQNHEGIHMEVWAVI